MCAIFGSFNKNTFMELAQLNSYRGQHSFSISIYDPLIKGIQVLAKKEGEFEISSLKQITGAGFYFIGHIQAPTTDAKTIDYIHPSTINDTRLWHNGIIKEDCIEMMQEKLGDTSPWDTHLLHRWINSARSLNDIDGTFSCLNYDKGVLYLFRNEISPMYWDDELNISSTRFPGSSKTSPNTLLEMDLTDKRLIKIGSFTTKENPYYFEFGA